MGQHTEQGCGNSLLNLLLFRYPVPEADTSSTYNMDDDFIEIIRENASDAGDVFEENDIFSLS